MKEPKNLEELRDNLQSSFDKASVKPDSNSQVRARVYEMILNSVNKILSVPSHETPKVGNNEKAKEFCAHPTCYGIRYKDGLCKKHYDKIIDKQNG